MLVLCAMHTSQYTLETINGIGKWHYWHLFKCSCGRRSSSAKKSCYMFELSVMCFSVHCIRISFPLALTDAVMLGEEQEQFLVQLYLSEQPLLFFARECCAGHDDCFLFYMLHKTFFVISAVKFLWFGNDKGEWNDYKWKCKLL